MTTTCPHCKKENRVGGYYFRPAVESTGIKNDNRVTCGFCGKAFLPSGSPYDQTPRGDQDGHRE